MGLNVTKKIRDVEFENDDKYYLKEEDIKRMDENRAEIARIKLLRAEINAGDWREDIDEYTDVDDYILNQQREDQYYIKRKLAQGYTLDQLNLLAWDATDDEDLEGALEEGDEDIGEGCRESMYLSFILGFMVGCSLTSRKLARNLYTPFAYYLRGPVFGGIFFGGLLATAATTSCDDEPMEQQQQQLHSKRLLLFGSHNIQDSITHNIRDSIPRNIQDSITNNIREDSTQNIQKPTKQDVFSSHFDHIFHSMSYDW